MIRCPSCSREVAEESRFCSSCGSDLSIAGNEPATETSLHSSPSSPPSYDSMSGGRFLPGAILEGRYRIVGLLGRGGMGEVYRADDLKLGQTVALKFLPENLEKDPRRMARLLNEVKLARTVSHPNVCRVYDVGELDGAHFLSMEYVDGEDLASLLRRIGRLPREKAIELARQVCAGLGAAHGQGILHRDLKPANVMIDGQGRVKLTDFGLADLVDSISGVEIRSGTPAYMAPEQLAGKEVTVQSDVYALGLVLYELFTGKRVFDGKTAAEIARQQQETAPTNPSTLVGEIDDTVERVLLRCLESEPAARPASALAVAAALPGGDPLEAALAAGETPSPEMVAQAAEQGGLRPAIAVGCLVIALTSILLFAWAQSRTALYGRVPLELSPAELAVRARTALVELGHPEPPPHSYQGFVANVAYLDWVEENDESIDRWGALPGGSPPGALFWYRVGPAPLVPATLHGFRVTSDDPPQTERGSVSVLLDTTGDLVRLRSIPGERLEEAPPVVDHLPALFALAGLDREAWSAAAPVKAPDVPCDELMAWTADRDDRTTIVQACNFAGRIAYFETLDPWNLPSGPVAGDEGGGIGSFIGGLVASIIIIGGLLLAWRNMKAGRSDRRGALRLLLFMMTAMLLTWIVLGVSLRSFDPGALFQDLVFGRALGHALVHSVLVWWLYVGLEPYVRRLWPETLVSWSRLLLGRFRDPLIGRDLLVGLTIGAAIMAMGALLEQPLLGWAGSPGSSPDKSVFAGQGSLLFRDGIGASLITLETSIGVPMIFLLVFLLFRIVLRKTWLAAPAMVLLMTLLGLDWDATGAERVYGIAMSLLITGSVVFCILRFGLVSAIGLFLTFGLGQAPLTLDPSRFFAGYSLLSLGLFSALAIYTFITSLAGRAVFKSSWLDT